MNFIINCIIGTLSYIAVNSLYKKSKELFNLNVCKLLIWRKEVKFNNDKYINNVNFKYLSNLLKPKYIDMRKENIPIYKYYKNNLSIASAVAYLFEFDELKLNYSNRENNIKPSLSFINYNMLLEDGRKNIRNCLIGINLYGVCSNKNFPNDFTKKIPDNLCYDKAIKYNKKKFYKIYPHFLQIRSTLELGFPIIFGIYLFESFLSIKTRITGIIDMPKNNEKFIGGHVMVFVGYDDRYKKFIIRNSFGQRWGDHGYCYLPYEYVLQKGLINDLYILKKKEHTDIYYKIY